MLSDIELWLKSAIVPVAAATDDLGQDEQQIRTVINEYKLLIERIKEKESSLRELSENCDKLKSHSDVSHLANTLSEQLLMIRQLFQQQLLIITTNIKVFETHLVNLREQPTSIQSLADDTLDSKSMPEEEVLETIRSVEVNKVHQNIIAPLSIVTQTIETQTSASLREPIIPKVVPIDEEQQTSFPLDDKNIVNTHDHSVQTVKEKKPTENISITQTYTPDGHETIKFESGPNPTVSQVIEDVFVDAKYQQIPPNEAHRSSELLLRNVPESFETTFVEPDDTTTEVIVNPDGSKSIIVRKLTKTRQQVVQTNQQQQFTTVSTLIGSDMVPITQSVSQLNLENQRSTNVISGSAGTKTVIAQQSKGSHISGTSPDAMTVHEFEMEPVIEEYETRDVLPQEFEFQSEQQITDQTGEFEQSSIRAVVHQVTRRVIRRSRKIIKRVVIIDGKEHITEEIVEEPEEIEMTEEDAPQVNVNIIRMVNGKIVYQDTCSEEPVEQVISQIVAEINAEPVIQEPDEPSHVIQEPATEQEVKVDSQVFEIIPAPVELVIVDPAPVDVTKLPIQILPEGTDVEPSIEEKAITEQHELEPQQTTTTAITEEPTMKEPVEHVTEPEKIVKEITGTKEDKLRELSKEEEILLIRQQEQADLPEISNIDEIWPHKHHLEEQSLEISPRRDEIAVVTSPLSSEEAVSVNEIWPKDLETGTPFDIQHYEFEVKHIPEVIEEERIEDILKITEEEVDIEVKEQIEDKTTEQIVQLDNEVVEFVKEVTEPSTEHIQEIIQPIAIISEPISESDEVSDVFKIEIETVIELANKSPVEIVDKTETPVERTETPVERTETPVEITVNNAIETEEPKAILISKPSEESEKDISSEEYFKIFKKPVPVPRTTANEKSSIIDFRTATQLFLENETLTADPHTQTIKLSMPTKGSQSPGTLTVTLKTDQSDTPKVNVHLTEENLMPEAVQVPESICETEHDLTSKSEDSKRSRKKKKKKDKSSSSASQEQPININSPTETKPESAINSPELEIVKMHDTDISVKSPTQEVAEASIDSSVVESVELNVEDDNTISEKMEMPEYVETPIEISDNLIADCNPQIETPVAELTLEDHVVSIEEEVVIPSLSPLQKSPRVDNVSIIAEQTEEVIRKEQEIVISPDETYKSISEDKDDIIKVVEESLISPASESPKPIVAEIILTKSVLEGIYTDEAEQQTSPTKQLTESADTSPPSVAASLDVRSTQTSPEIKHTPLDISLQTTPEPIIEQLEQEIQTTAIEVSEIEIQTTPIPIEESDQKTLIVEQTTEEVQTDAVNFADETAPTRETIDTSIQTITITTREQELQTTPIESSIPTEEILETIPTEDIVRPIAEKICIDIVNKIPIEIEKYHEGTNTMVVETMESVTQTSSPSSVHEDISQKSEQSTSETTTSSEEPYEILIETKITVPDDDMSNKPFVVEVNRSFVVDESGDVHEHEDFEDISKDNKKKKNKKKKKGKKEPVELNVNIDLTKQFLDAELYQKGEPSKNIERKVTNHSAEVSATIQDTHSITQNIVKDGTLPSDIPDVSQISEISIVPVVLTPEIVGLQQCKCTHQIVIKEAVLEKTKPIEESTTSDEIHQLIPSIVTTVLPDAKTTTQNFLENEKCDNGLKNVISDLQQDITENIDYSQFDVPTEPNTIELNVKQATKQLELDSTQPRLVEPHSEDDQLSTIPTEIVHDSEPDQSLRELEPLPSKETHQSITTITTTMFKSEETKSEPDDETEVKATSVQDSQQKVQFTITTKQDIYELDPDHKKDEQQVDNIILPDITQNIKTKETEVDQSDLSSASVSPTIPEGAVRVQLTITTQQDIYEPLSTSKLCSAQTPVQRPSAKDLTHAFLQEEQYYKEPAILTEKDVVVITEIESPELIAHEIVPIVDEPTKPNLLHLSIGKTTLSNTTQNQLIKSPSSDVDSSSSPSDDKITFAPIKLQKTKPTSSVTIEEALSPTEELIVPLTPGLDLAEEYERVPDTIWSTNLLQGHRVPTSEDFIQSELQLPAQPVSQQTNFQWNSASNVITDRIRNINNIRNTHLSNVLHLATLSEVVTEEPIGNRIVALHSNVNQLEDAIEQRNTVVTQKTVILIIETVSTWLETIEYRVYSIRQQSSDGPSEQKVKAYTDLNTELQHIADNVERVAHDLDRVKEFVAPAEEQRMSTCFDTLKSQVKAVEEITKENEDQATADLLRWNEFMILVDLLIVSIRKRQEQFDFIITEDISIEEKLGLLDELEYTNREQHKEINNLLILARTLIRDFPGKEIPQDVYGSYEASRNLENDISMERGRLLQLQTLAEEYDQTLNEFAQITLLADSLVEKPITASTLEQLQQEMQKHRKFFVNLSHCRSILESLEENLDKDTRERHSDLHKKLHDKASNILDKASERAQRISLAASRWTVLEKGMREERQWLQVAQQRVPDLSAVTSADYDRYITMYQSLNSDISNHHAKLLQLTNMAGRLQELVTAPNLEEENNDALLVLLRLKEEVTLYLRRLTTFREIWTIYEMLSDKLENWIKEAERDISRIELPQDMRTQPIENMRQFWEVKVHYELHNNIRNNVGDNFEKAIQILPLADEILQRQFHNQLEDRWASVSDKINGIQNAIVNSISAQDIPINEKLALLERELQELQLNITSAKGVIKNEDELNLYIERMQVLKSRIDIIGNELGRIGMLPSTEPEHIGELFALSHRIATQIAEELEGASMLKDRLIVIQQGITRIRKHQYTDSELLDECESHEKLGSEQIEKALVDCQNISEDLIGQWQEIMRLRQLLHTLPMRLRVSVSPVKLERDISQLQDEHAVLESRCANILSMLKNRLVLWRRFERQLEIVQQSVQETDYMMELLKVNGHIDYERLKKATERLEVCLCFTY